MQWPIPCAITTVSNVDQGTATQPGDCLIGFYYLSNDTSRVDVRLLEAEKSYDELV